MRKNNSYLFGIFLIIQFSCTTKEHYNMNYPALSKQIARETYFGKEVKDFYRNLEDLNDSTVIKWYDSQNDLANLYLNKISGKKSFLENLNKKQNEQKSILSNLKITDNDAYFYLKRLPTENTAKLYYRSSFSNEEQFLFDPKEYDENSGIEYKINYIQPSWDASKIVIGLTHDDKEVAKLVTLDIKTRVVLKGHAPNSIPNAFGGIEWLPDSSGFIYTYMPSTSLDDKNKLENIEAVIYKIGEPNTTIKPIFSKKNNSEIPFENNSIPIVYFTHPNDKIILGANVVGSSRYRDTYYTLSKNIEDKPFWKLYYTKDEKITSFKIAEDYFYYRTAKGASNFKICKTSLTNPDFENPIVLVKEDSSAVITDFTITAKGLFYVKTKNGVQANLYHLNETTSNHNEIPLPKASGYLSVIAKNHLSDDLWIEIEGWINKKERYKYNHGKNEFEIADLIPNQAHQELSDVVIEEIEIPSHDGVNVPLSIVYKKGIKKDKNNRLLINAYGAYKWSNSPFMYDYLIHWIKEGGIYAIAHVRGGGEKGDDWHKAGYKSTKPNTWKDLIACTEYFVDNHYVSQDKIVAWGASAGGISIGRAITERPDLYAAAIIRVGILNPLRLEFSPTGAFNAKEFGTVKDSIEFIALYEMDSCTHIKDNTEYPAIYLTAGLNDTRVVAWQPGKFVARIQEASSSNKPVLFSVDKKGGHGFEATKEKKNEELANIISFALWQTGHPDYQLKK